MSDHSKEKMRVLTATVAALIILVTYTSSYGYFLVYNISGGMAGIENLEKESVHFHSYMVMTFDNDTNDLVDTNMIVYGEDTNDHKVFVQLNASDANQFLEAHILERTVRNFYSLNAQTPFGFWAFIMGNVKKTTIGPDLKKYIAPKLNGDLSQQQGIFFNADISFSGVGHMSANLNSSETKKSNDPENGATQDTVVADLRQIVIDKHYRELIIQAPD